MRYTVDIEMCIRDRSYWSKARRRQPRAPTIFPALSWDSKSLRRTAQVPPSSNRQDLRQNQMCIRDSCWTAMVLDFLPYKVPESPRKPIGFIRYISFAASFLFVSILFLQRVGHMERIMFWSFLIGNAIYYILGISLALIFKDNRAFCKYICPITVFLKPMSYFSLFRIKCDKEKCVSCGRCKKVCPMDVDMTDNSRKRKNGTECILCMECVKACPKKAL